MSAPASTAGVLIAFRKELVDAGWSDDLVHQVMVNAANDVVRINGITVKS